MTLQAHERQAQSSANCTSLRATAAVPGTADEGEDHRLPRFRVTVGRFDGIAGVLHVFELDALDHTATIDVEAGDDSLC